jgi:two-component system sensor histidine kinase DegS
MSEDLLTALENERRYVARELHDGVAQTMLQLGLQAGICRKLLEHDRLEMLTTELAQLEERIQLASGQIREMIADMRPPQVDPAANLDEYFRQLIDLHRERGGPPVEYRNDWPASPPLSEPQQLALVRVVQEVLQNVRKHAQAQKTQLKLEAQESTYRVIIADDGQGFDLAEVKTRSTDNGGAGLANLAARVTAIGGELRIEKKETGQGTIVTVSLAG